MEGNADMIFAGLIGPPPAAAAAKRYHRREENP
jgi:hypothetical protein